MKTSELSIFSHSLDRTAVLVYALGAGVPLAALAYVVERFVLPEVPDGPFAFGLVGLVISIGALSLGSFLVLQRVTHQSIRHLDEQNHRLKTMLEAARWVADAPYGDEVLRAIATCATRLGDATAAFVLTREKQDELPTLAGSAGEETAAIYSRIDPSLATVIELQVDISGGAYDFRFRNVEPGSYLIVAGTDSDNDSIICDAGEACGAYPARDELEPLEVDRNVNNAGFSTGFSTAFEAAMPGATPGGGFSRLPAR